MMKKKKNYLKVKENNSSKVEELKGHSQRVGDKKFTLEKGRWEDGEKE